MDVAVDRHDAVAGTQQLDDPVGTCRYPPRVVSGNSIALREVIVRFASVEPMNRKHVFTGLELVGVLRKVNRYR